MYNLMQVAKRYCVSRSTVRSWIEGGDLAAIDVAPAGGRHRFYRVTEDALADFERDRASGATLPVVPPTTKSYV